MEDDSKFKNTRKPSYINKFRGFMEGNGSYLYLSHK